MPFRDLLTAVARSTGVALRGLAHVEGTASLRFADRSLHDGLEALLASYDYAVVEERMSEEAGPRTTVIIVGRRVDPNSGKPLASALPEVASVAEFAAVRDDDDYRRIERLAEQGDLNALRAIATSGGPLSRALSLQRLAQRDPGHALRIATDAATSGDPTERVLALQVLGTLDCVDAANVLGAALGDRDAGVRQAAAVALLGQSSPVATRLLEGAWKDHSELAQFLTPDGKGVTNR